MNFRLFSFSTSNSAIILRIFYEFFVWISRQIPENSEMCGFFNRICDNNFENCRKNLKSVKIIHYYSVLFIRVRSRSGSTK